MSNLNRSLIFTEQISLEKVFSVFDLASQFKSESKIQPLFKDEYKRALLLFFEPSTRTKVSFQLALEGLGIQTIKVDVNADTSQSKGETNLDTLKNIVAMRPDLLVVRYGDEPDLTRYLEQISVPVINAGGGVSEHPTQALLDAFTLKEEWGDFKGKKVLFMGDLKHSRVASSNIVLLNQMGVELAAYSNKNFLPESTPGLRLFDSLQEGLRWCDACMALRPQKERFNKLNFSIEEYADTFCLRANHLELMHDSAIVMHPGPWNESVDIEEEVVNHPKSRVFNQVENGVFIRAALTTVLLRGK